MSWVQITLHMYSNIRTERQLAIPQTLTAAFYITHSEQKTANDEKNYLKLIEDEIPKFVGN